MFFVFGFLFFCFLFFGFFLGRGTKKEKTSMQNKVNIHLWCLPIVMLFLFLPLPSLPNWFLGWFRWQIGSSPSVFILLPAQREEGRTNKLKTKHFLRIRNVKQSCKVSENTPTNLKLTNQDV